jgi:hypothetical protein
LDLGLLGVNEWCGAELDRATRYRDSVQG